MTNPSQIQATCRELAERVLPFIRRQDEPHTMKQLIARFSTSKTLMWGAIGLLLGTEAIRFEMIKGSKCYVATVDGVRTPPRMTLNMTSTYRLPQALVEQGEKCLAARAIKSKFD